MNNMKRFVALMLVLCMGVCLCACVDAGPTEPSTAPSTEPTTQPTDPTTQPTDPTTQPTDDGKVDYTVTVLYPDGTNVGAGVYVQICLAELCYNPVETNENGVATVRLTQQEGYKTKLLMDVAGYTYEVAEDGYVHFAEGSTEITITLVAVEG